ncbi:MAG TPA: endonuclease III, partial [Rhodothermia bacterium]
NKRTTEILAGLRQMIPSPETELEYVDPFQLLVAVILSAQCTDDRVNMVTPALFERYPTPGSMAKAEPEDIYPFIKSVTYPNNKSKHLVGAARKIVAEFGGEVPDDVPHLVKLPGVGRKTAQVVASVVFERDALPVDTHVFRVANRIGLVRDAKTPLAVEKGLKRILPKEDWSEAHHLLILHGRYTCTARSPKCDSCLISDNCLYFSRLIKLPEPKSGLKPSKGRYHCGTCGRYFDTPAIRRDRYDIDQFSCPSCSSMNVFESKNGATTKRIPDFRVG